MRALIFDSDTELANETARTLERAKWEVIRTVDATQAATLCAEGSLSVDAILLDPVAPDGAGLTLLDALSSLRTRPHVVALTAFPSEVTRAHLPAIDLVVEKPLAPQALEGLAKTLAFGAEATTHVFSDRLRDVLVLRLLAGTLDEERLRDLTGRIARFFHAPFALCTLHLPDKTTLTAASGAEAWAAEIKELLGRLKVPVTTSDAALHPVLGPCACVAALGLRAFVSLPLLASTGTFLGTIAVADVYPRAFLADELGLLELLARLMATEFELRLAEDDAQRARTLLRDRFLIDPTTGLWSRAAFAERAEIELGRCAKKHKTVVHLRVAVERYDDIVDKAGRDAAEKAMSSAVTAIVEILEDRCLLGRTGDDQISILVPELEERSALALAERIRAAVRQRKIMVPGTSAQVVVSIGVALGTTNGAILSRRAEIALTSARQRGRDRVELFVLRQAGQAEMDRPLEPGHVLEGKYYIEGELAAGGMGIVYRAVDLHLERNVAVKVLHSRLASSASFSALFRAEASKMAAVLHPNLAEVYAFGEDLGLPFLVMELISGPSVEDEVSSEASGTLPPERVASIVVQIASALDSVHTAGLVHRDVKPANILCDHAQGRAVLVDFGIASRLRDAGEGRCGTNGYMAPETLAGQTESAATDVFSLGVSAYRMLTGNLPFALGGPADAPHAIAPVPPSYLASGMAALDPVVLKALAVDPAQRYQTASAFAAAFADKVRMGASVPGPKRAEKDHDPPTVKRPALFRPPLATPSGPMTGDTRIEARIRGNLLRAAQRAAKGALGMSEPVAESPAWYPADEFFAVLSALRAAALSAGNSAEEVARHIGATAVAEALRLGHVTIVGTLLGSTAHMLDAIPTVWRRLSEVSQISVVRNEEHGALLFLQDPPANALFADVVAGVVLELATEAHLANPRLAIESREATAATLSLHWR